MQIGYIGRPVVALPRHPLSTWVSLFQTNSFLYCHEPILIFNRRWTILAVSIKFICVACGKAKRLYLRLSAFAILLSILLVFGSAQPVMAQSQPPNIKAEQLQQLDELAESLSANIGDFATAETYWTEILAIPDNPAAWVTGASESRTS